MYSACNVFARCWEDEGKTLAKPAAPELEPPVVQAPSRSSIAERTVANRDELRTQTARLARLLAGGNACADLILNNHRCSTMLPLVVLYWKRRYNAISLFYGNTINRSESYSLVPWRMGK